MKIERKHEYTESKISTSTREGGRERYRKDVNIQVYPKDVTSCVILISMMEHHTLTAIHCNALNKVESIDIFTCYKFSLVSLRR